MQIPPKLRGHWRGTVKDVLRERPYEGEITLSENSADTKYDMAQGAQKGQATFLYESNGFLLLDEVTDRNWKGTLLLYLNVDDTIKCVWRLQGGSYSAEAVMTRMETVS